MFDTVGKLSREGGVETLGVTSALSAAKISFQVYLTIYLGKHVWLIPCPAFHDFRSGVLHNFNNNIDQTINNNIMVIDFVMSFNSRFV